MCSHFLGSLPCDNPDAHEGGDLGHGCTHTGMWAPDHHDEGPTDD